jgi:hypothetical protein
MAMRGRARKNKLGLASIWHNDKKNIRKRNWLALESLSFFLDGRATLAGFQGCWRVNTDKEFVTNR